MGRFQMVPFLFSVGEQVRKLYLVFFLGNLQNKVLSDDCNIPSSLVEYEVLF